MIIEVTLAMTTLLNRFRKYSTQMDWRVIFTETRAALLRASNLHIDSMVWMEEYFYQYESQPNAAQIHVDATFKRSIWQEYCKASLPSEGRLSEVIICL